MSEKQKDKKLFVSTILLVILHLAGFIGLHTSYRELFLQLTPFNLLVSALLLFLNQKDTNWSFYIFCFITFSFGYFIEVLGVKTGFIFGPYVYGNMLGFRLAGVPLVIGLNWLMLVYSVGIICNRLKTNLFLKSIAGAGMLVALDLFIEPVAIKYNFWRWENVIPVQNYIAWFITSLLMLFIFYRASFEKNNPMANALYIVQLVFFILLGNF